VDVRIEVYLLPFDLPRRQVRVTPTRDPVRTVPFFLLFESERDMISEASLAEGTAQTLPDPKDKFFEIMPPPGNFVP